MDCMELFEIMKYNGKNEKNYQEFLYRNTFYLIDQKKLNFTLSILKTDKEEFFSIENLKKFFCEHDLLSEEFLEFISIMYRKVEF